MITTTESVDVSLKPRVLIADDSRIVRATLIKHIQGMFEFREALDGVQAWEILLLDPSIKVLITDLTMPKLDGYGLLERVRSSKIARIRNLPVIVVSGSDEQEERERAKKAGATELITKGIGTAQLLSRLDVLSKLTNTQREYESSLERFVQSGIPHSGLQLASLDDLKLKADAMMAVALRHKRNLVVFGISVGVAQPESPDKFRMPQPVVVNAIGRLLAATVRQTDIVAMTGAAEFTIVTCSIHLESARTFAARLCQALAGANLIFGEQQIRLIASCGLVSKCSEPHSYTDDAPELIALASLARRRGALGLHCGISGVVGSDEESLYEQKFGKFALFC